MYLKKPFWAQVVYGAWARFKVACSSNRVAWHNNTVMADKLRLKFSDKYGTLVRFPRSDFIVGTLGLKA